MLNGGCLFPSQHSINPPSTRQLGRACIAASKDAEIEKLNVTALIDLVLSITMNLTPQVFLTILIWIISMNGVS
jgi:hypothetical protein